MKSKKMFHPRDIRRDSEPADNRVAPTYRHDKKGEIERRLGAYAKQLRFVDDWQNLRRHGVN